MADVSESRLIDFPSTRSDFRVAHVVLTFRMCTSSMFMFGRRELANGMHGLKNKDKKTESHFYFCEEDISMVAVAIGNESHSTNAIKRCFWLSIKVGKLTPHGFFLRIRFPRRCKTTKVEKLVNSPFLLLTKKKNRVNVIITIYSIDPRSIVLFGCDRRRKQSCRTRAAQIRPSS